MMQTKSYMYVSIHLFHSHTYVYNLLTKYLQCGAVSFCVCVHTFNKWRNDLETAFIHKVTISWVRQCICAEQACC